MQTRTRNLLLAAVLCLCAYGLGMLVGHGAKQALQSRAASQRSGGTRSEMNASASLVEERGTEERAFVADSSAFLPTLSTTTLQYFESQVRTLDGMGNKEAFAHKLEEIRPLLFLLSTNDYPKIWAWLKGLRSSDAKGCVRYQLLEIWSKKDPRAAIEVVMALPEGHEREMLMRGLPANYGASNPEAALAWVRQLPAGEQRDIFLTDMIGGIAERDVVIATRLVDELPPGSLRDGAVWRIVEHCLNTDPAAAAGLANKARTVFQQQGLFRYVGAAWAERSLPEALAWAQGLNNQGDRDSALAGVVRQMAQTQPGVAANLVLSQAEASSRYLLAKSLVAGWAQSDLPAAVEWTTRLPDNLCGQAWEGLQEQWVHLDPEGAANFALQSLPAGETRTAALTTLARKAAEAGWDEQAALRWVGRLPAGPERDAFLLGWCTQSVPGFGPRPEAVAPLVALMSPGKRRDAAIEAIALEWMQIDSGAARKWVQQARVHP